MSWRKQNSTNVVPFVPDTQFKLMRGRMKITKAYYVYNVVYVGMYCCVRSYFHIISMSLDELKKNIRLLLRVKYVNNLSDKWA